MAGFEPSTEAAHARAIDAVCVTDNVAEFRRVPALKIENWLK
jgi:tRNA(fMet)-specific endonuclease VapC